MEVINTSYRIGKLTRTIRMKVYEWGINVVVEDRTDNQPNAKFRSRNYRMANTYKTIEGNITKVLKRYNAPETTIEDVIKNCELKNNE